MRPGLSRYSATVGQVRQYGDGNDLFGDLTYQRGLTNALTVNLGYPRGRRLVWHC